ncbi:hypothetical protein [Tindallia californiensis]|uniref:Uncharacterized protein n=1 Tax=Tindallia californiensis TaxID=159292 RepID=A0A1H3I5D2_9FIRM|nr:hypothetical protein [Tindallia californiensis]SDY22389.1 hypothetical protein SAMN05192546_1014 [Tindallia californiensis]
MPVTNVIAKVKKINLDNKVIGIDWKQAITITLGDIELTDANLIALRKFRPNEEVLVNLKTMQLAFSEIEEDQRIRMLEENTDATPTEEPAEPEEEAAICIDEETSDFPEDDSIKVDILPADHKDDVDPRDVVQSFVF